MTAALSDLTIVEIADGVATRYCGHLFAAHGATVLQVGTPFVAAVGYGGAASEAFSRWLDQRKRRIDGDLASVLRTLAKPTDLLIAGQDAPVVAAVDETMRSAGLGNAMRLGLTWFATDGPYRDWTGSDAVIQAMSAVAYATGERDGAPILPRGHAPQVIGGATAFIAGLAALLGRDAGWVGRHIDVNILEANLCLSESGAASAALTGDRTVRRGVNRFTPTFPGGIYRASDGWIGVTALTPAQWLSLCDLIARPDLRKEPRFLISLQRMESADEIEPHLIAAFKEKPASYWLDEGQRLRIPVAPVPDLAELPRTAHWRERGSFAEVPGVAGAIGPTMPFHSQASPVVSVREPRAMEGTAWPLSGLRVLDLSMGWAGPLAARHLADLGADVVKVESCTHFDWWRGFDGPVDGDPPPYETRPSFLMVNRNKRGITLDLKTDAGKALVRKLAAQSDVMIENYAPGVLDKLDIGAKSLVQVAPDLICLSMGAFGASGPWRSFRAYGSTVEQASGLPFVNGEASDPPTMQHVAYGDPIAGLYGAIACLISVCGRNRHGAGAIIDLGQVECLFQLCADAIVAQSTQKQLLEREGSRHPASMLRAVAASQTPGRWIAVSVETTDQWDALCSIVGRRDLAAAASSRIADLKLQEPALERALVVWCAQRSASEAVATLQSAKVAAGPVYAAVDLLDDPQCVRDDFWRRTDRPFIGNHVVPHAPYRLDGKRPPVWRASPTLGEHNEAVLAGDLGLASAEIDGLREQGIIGNRAGIEA